MDSRLVGLMIILYRNIKKHCLYTLDFRYCVFHIIDNIFYMDEFALYVLLYHKLIWIR